MDITCLLVFMEHLFLWYISGGAKMDCIYYQVASPFEMYLVLGHEEKLPNFRGKCTICVGIIYFLHVM